MPEEPIRRTGDSIIIEMHPGQEPVELSNLSDSFAALARIYERHYRSAGDEAPKLYVTRLQTGSVIMEVAPLAVLLGYVTWMDNALIVADFTNRLWRGIKAFSSPAEARGKVEIPTRDDARDIREFAKPLLGINGAHLGIKHARFEKGEGERKIVIEYDFDEAELNRAAINIEKALELPPPTLPDDAPEEKIHREVVLFLEQAHRGPGKEVGRTGDRGVIPDISERVVPVYFHQSVRPLKERMMHGEENPFELAFVVDAHVTVLNGVVRAYTITEIHDSFPRT